MSPEQMEYGTTNEYSDVYSFGMTIYEVRHYYLLNYILHAPLRFSLVTFHLMISPGHRCVARWLIAKTGLLNPDDNLLLTAGLTMCCGDSL